jgi:hypothetical protein
MEQYLPSSILAGQTQTQRKFNPADKKDLLELKFFKENKKWKNKCPFVLTFPYLEIPNMCDSMYTEHMLSKMKA